MGLLQDIENSIERAGGRLSLAKLIMNENRESFTYKEHKEIEKLAEREVRLGKGYKRKSTYLWPIEDDIYLFNNYDFRDIERLARRLGRSTWALRQRMTLLKNRYRNYEMGATSNQNPSSELGEHLETRVISKATNKAA